MTDLHCHILPGMDDGARNAMESLELVKQEYEYGVKNIALTSHFNSNRISIEAFVEKRKQAFASLQEAQKEAPMEITYKLGAEVFFTPKLCEMDVQRLCMEGTSYLLVEFPVTHRPHLIRETFRHLSSQGVYPIIAHVERYPFLMENPQLVYELVSAGAYTQVNAESLLQKVSAKQALQLIRWELVHVVATDTHSMSKRPPRMPEAFRVIEKSLGQETVEGLQKNAAELFYDMEIDIEPHYPRKLFGRWK